MKPIRGAGGGGKGGGGGTTHVPVESPDSLRSRQYARVLDLISEGEIGGLVDGAKSVYLDETPLANPDGSWNFTGVTLDTRVGTQGQTYIPGIPAVESEAAVSVEVKASAAVTRQISNANADAVRVTLGIPQLTYQNPTTGDLGGTSVQIAIDLQANGGGYVQQLIDTISGKTTTRYQRSYRLELTGSPPWDIRVRRITADSVTANLVNKTWWESLTEIVDAKLSYPNSALVAIEVDASQFNNIPRRGYDIRGLKVLVPSNYDPELRAYDGIWDGTFQLAWTDNPAWCWYDLITSPRYGLGEFVDAAQVDKWALYEIAQYCDGLVEDGFGGQEPRFTCNLVLQTRQEAYEVVANMASIFRGMTFWAAGAVTAVADKPEDAVALFTAANVLGGEFSYQGSARSARHTVALVSWNDPADRYRQKIEYVEDVAGIARYGVRSTDVLAFGCTSRGQAHRLGRWLLYSERLETEMVTFRVGLDGHLVAPGAVIKTLDPPRAGKRHGGRVVSATTTAVTVDAAVTIESGKTYTLHAFLPDGSVEQRAVTNGTGATSVLAVSPALSAAPQAQAVWILEASDLVPESWRVIAVTEVEKNIVEIAALEHDTRKFDAIEQNLVLEPLPTSVLTSRPPAPINLQATESLYEAGPGVVSTRVALSWEGTTGRYAVAWRLATDNWVTLPEQPSQTVNLDGIEPGEYSFTVQQINALGVRSQPATLTRTVYGKTAAPADVAGFSVIKSAGVGIAQWVLADDLDVRVGGRIVVRHSPLTTGATWQDSIIVETFDGNAVSGIVPLMTGTYFAKALDSSGNYSETAASFVATEGMVTGFTTVGSSVQHSAFTGAKTNVVLSSGAIQLSSTTLIDDMVTPVDEWGFIDSLGGISATGSYAFDTYLDLSTVATRRFEADVRAQQFDVGDLISTRTDPVSEWESIAAGIVEDCDVTLYASVTDDNPSGSPTWGPWVPFFVADFTCRAARFKLDFVSGSPTHNIKVDQLRVDAKIPA